MRSRLRILEEAFSPDACVAHVARRHDISTALIYTWRKKFSQPEPGFVEAVVDDGAERARECPAIVIELSRGGRVSISATASPALATAVLKALR